MAGTQNYAIECEGLGRTYTSRGLLGGKQETVALEALDLQIPKGVVFGLLGPNGAGKTTTVRILSTLLTPTRGAARVLGFDEVRQASQVRRNIGLILAGERGLYGRLTGQQNLAYFGALNHMRPKQASSRGEELLDQVGLAGARNTLVEEYSRGMKQRLHVARGLLADPSVIFMDEPTIGLDPIAAQELRRHIPELVERGKTVLLTTHYMVEADMLCDNIAIIDKGRLVNLGTPSEIKRRFSAISMVEVTVRATREDLLEEVRTIEGVEQADASACSLQRITVHVRSGTAPQDRVMAAIGEDNVETMVEREAHPGGSLRQYSQVTWGSHRHDVVAGVHGDDGAGDAAREVAA